MIAAQLLTHFVKNLYSATVERDEFENWRKCWIASNGPLERKKNVDTNVICVEYEFPEESFDLYKFVFAVESALVCCADGVRSVVTSPRPNTEKSAAEKIFFWWAGDEKCQTANAAIYSQLSALGLRALSEHLTKDPLRDLYHAILPKAVRHTLGAFLTPTHLCIYTLEQTCQMEDFFKGDLRVLEPNCGFGSFLTAIFQKSLDAVTSEQLSGNSIALAISENFVGLEKNLASYCVSKALSETYVAILSPGSALQTQIYWTDSIFFDPILLPQYGQVDIGAPTSLKFNAANLLLSAEQSIVQEALQTGAQVSESDFRVVEELDELGIWRNNGKQLDEHLRSNTSNNRQLVMLAMAHDFASRRLARFDCIIGNPPWVNWENIDPHFRDLCLPMWPLLGLFEMKGRDRAFSKEDLCVLATSISCYRFGKEGTRVGFVLPQSIFQARKNSRGFRRFQIANGLFLRISKVVDFAEMATFGDAKTRAAVLCCELSQKQSKYPIDYLVPAKKSKESNIVWKEMQAFPSDPSDLQTNWALYDGRGKEHGDFKATHKKTTYKARTGVFTGGANAIYYVKVIHDQARLVKLANDTDRAKIKVPDVVFEAEREFLYPFAKGRDLSQWRCSRPLENGILLPHTKSTKIKPVPPDQMRELAPLTLEYFGAQQPLLATRASLTALDRANVSQGFYALLRVGEYTFAPYKLAWKYISKNFCCAVVGPSKIAGDLRPTILQEKLISVAFDTAEEAYFVCGWLSAPQVTAEIERRIVGTQVSAHVIEDIHLPAFDPSSANHQKISALCKLGHEQAALGMPISKFIAEIATLAV